jgi:hypothetical protein
MSNEKEEEEEVEHFEDYHVTEEEIRDMRVEGKEFFEENPKVRSQSDEEIEKQGKQMGDNRLLVLKELLLQRVLKGEITVEESNRLLTQDRIRIKREAIRKMEIIYEIKRREFKSLSSKQAKQEHVKTMRQLQGMIETGRRKLAQDEDNNLR